jgi:bifunctional N-acetylglucosamine-1-phosphate-uridyltransferase/glucosamine-1-phosphate-acetyltransferase GlmU-like protein
MTSRLLVVPAAGLGTRLGAARPKLLVPVGGVPMIDRLLRLFAPSIDRALVVVHPSFDAEVRQHVTRSPVPTAIAVQQNPTGMLDAILLAQPAVREAAPDEVWIAWCDQVAIHPDTLRRLAVETASHRDAALVMPTVVRLDPYIHLDRDPSGRIVRVLHRREGDRMPERGESDMGLFALPRESFSGLLPRYADGVAAGAGTGERNFLPFIAWANRDRDVVTFPAVDEMEAVGVNTPAELAAVEAYLASREARRP